MPYITNKLREKVEPCSVEPASNAGELNYQITRLVARFLGDEPNYAKYNDAIGALECAKLELYRRLIAPYENHKNAINGDVY